MSIVPSLLQAIVHVDGEAMVMHAGEKPYVVSPTGQTDLASRGLTLEAVNGVVNQLLPAEFQAALDEFGAVQYELPPSASFPGDNFTVVAARGGDDIWVEIRRRRSIADEILTEDIFECPPAEARAEAPASSVAPASDDSEDAIPPELIAPRDVPVSAAPMDDDGLDVPDAPHLWPAAAPAAATSELVAATSDAAAATNELDEFTEHVIELDDLSSYEAPPALLSQPEAVARVEQELVADIESEPVLDIDLEPVADIAPAPIAHIEPELVVHIEPEPIAQIEAEAVAETPSVPELELVPPPVEAAEPVAELELVSPVAYEEAIAIPHLDLAPEQAEPAPVAQLELQPVAEPEAEPIPSAEGSPVAAEQVELEPIEHVEPEPVAEIEFEPFAEVEPEPFAEVEPEPVAEVEPEPFAEVEPEPVAEIEPEPVAEVEPEPFAEIEPEPVAEIEPEPVAEVEPEPVAEIELEPVAQVQPEPPAEMEPESIAEIEPEPVLVAAPELVAHVEPEPVVYIEPEPVAEIELEPAACIEPEPLEEIEPEPIAQLAPEPIIEVDLEPMAYVGPEPAPYLEPEPVAFVEPEPIAFVAPEPIAVVEPEAMAFVQPDSVAVVMPEPVAEVAPEQIPEPIAHMQTEPKADAHAPEAQAAPAPVAHLAPQPPPHPAPELVTQVATPPAVAAAAPAPVEPPARPAPQPANVLPLSRSPIRSEGAPTTAGSVVGPAAAGLEGLLRVAAARGASTLYLSADTRPSVRVDGELQMLDNEPELSARDVESLLLTLMPERSHEALRTGAATEWICDIEGVGRVRCMSFRDHLGPGGVFRLMPTRSVSPEQLGLSRSIQALAIEPEGLVLVAGPRSSGKRTLMAALVELINRSRRDHVITIEREINIVHERGSAFISQREVRGNDDDMLAAARAALREDPDVLVIEDLHTGGLMNVALEAASSGHLVIGGFAAHTAASAIDRIIDLYAPDQRRRVQFALADTLRGAIVQVLVRKTGGGRIAAREVLLNTPAVSSVLAEGKTSQLPMAIEGGRRHGMVPLNDSLVGFVQNGLVDAREAYRYSPDRPGFLALLKRQGIDTSFAERLA